MARQIQAVVFDCFGVLVKDALSALCAQLTDTQKREVVDILHASHRGFMSPEESNQKVATLLGLELQAYRAAIQAGEVKNRELLDYITELKKQYKIGMLSNVSRGGIARRFTATELACFDIVVASGDVGRAKPDPEAYHMVAERLDVAPKNCVFTDDNIEYCEGAEAVGMQAILYEGFGQFKTDLTKVLA